MSLADGMDAALAGFACLPVHPQPFQGESVSSWLFRLSTTNGVSVHRLLTSCLGGQEWRRRDADFLDENQLSKLAALGRVEGGEAVLGSMTLTRWADVTGSPSSSDRKSWIASLEVVRYCPFCVSEDQSPFLRPLWRLHLIPFCAKHHAVLNRMTAARWHRFPRVSPLTAQRPENGLDSAEGPRAIALPPRCENLARLPSTVEGLFQESMPSELFRWPYTMFEFFEVLRFTLRFLNLHVPRSGSLEQIQRSYGLQLTPPYDWRRNEAFACIILEESLRLLEDWPKNMAPFVAQHQSEFNRMCDARGTRLPVSLEPFRKKSHTWPRQTLPLTLAASQKRAIRIVSAVSDEDRVWLAVQELLRRGSGVNHHLVSKITHIGWHVLKEEKRFDTIIEDGKAEMRRRIVSDQAAAARELRSRGLSVTKTSVADYVGVSWHSVGLL